MEPRSQLTSLRDAFRPSGRYTSESSGDPLRATSHRSANIPSSRSGAGLNGEQPEYGSPTAESLGVRSLGTPIYARRLTKLP